MKIELIDLSETRKRQKAILCHPSAYLSQIFKIHTTDTVGSKGPNFIYLSMYRVFIKYCVFFFENFEIYSGLWTLSVFQRCVNGRHNGR